MLDSGRPSPRLFGYTPTNEFKQIGKLLWFIASPASIELSRYLEPEIYFSFKILDRLSKGNHPE